MNIEITTKLSMKVRSKLPDGTINWSTMFPDDKTEVQVAKAIEYVFNSGVKDGNIITGFDATGIKIEIILFGNGTLKTAYPILL